MSAFKIITFNGHVVGSVVSTASATRARPAVIVHQSPSQGVPVSSTTEITKVSSVSCLCIYSFWPGLIAVYFTSSTVTMSRSYSA